MSMTPSVRLPHLLFVLLLLLSAWTAGARAQEAPAPVAADPAMLGAWTVVAAADANDVGLRFFFPPDGIFLMATHVCRSAPPVRG